MNVRRRFVFVEQFIEEGVHWAVFERKPGALRDTFGRRRYAAV